MNLYEFERRDGTYGKSFLTESRGFAECGKLFKKALNGVTIRVYVLKFNRFF